MQDLRFQRLLCCRFQLGFILVLAPSCVLLWRMDSTTMCSLLLYMATLYADCMRESDLMPPAQRCSSALQAPLEDGVRESEPFALYSTPLFPSIAGVTGGWCA